MASDPTTRIDFRDIVRSLRLMNTSRPTEQTVVKNEKDAKLEDEEKIKDEEIDNYGGLDL